MVLTDSSDIQFYPWATSAFIKMKKMEEKYFLN